MGFKPATKTERAYRKMRRMIIEGKFDSGKRLSLRAIARQLDVSVVPVSEAVRRLEVDGLIVTKARSGIHLRELTVSQLKEMQVVREALEVQAVRIVAFRFHRDADKARTLRSMARQLQEHLANNEQQLAHAIDFDLHMTIVEWAGCGILTEEYARLATQCMVAERGGWSDAWYRREKEGPEGHQYLVEAILSGDVDRAEDAVRCHIKAGVRSNKNFHPPFPHHSEDILRRKRS